jgi:YegS/Rv2252/BmrU family lipid kinase
MIAGTFVLIANPYSGRGRAGDIMREAVTALNAAGSEALGELTTSINHATELANQAVSDGRSAVAVGGDGLLRAVVAGAAIHGGTVGIIPAGRGNDFARTLGIRPGVEANIRTLLTASPRPADCIAVSPGATEDRVRDRHDIAIGNVYLGFDSFTNIRANEMRLNLGPLTYKFAALHAALTLPPLTFRLSIDGRHHEYQGSGVAIANSVFYGAGVPLAPAADVQDGLLDVVMFQQTTRRSRVPGMLAMTHAGHLKRPDVQHVLAREVRVEVDPPTTAYSDGDPICRTPFTARVMPGAIQLLRP